MLRKSAIHDNGVLASIVGLFNVADVDLTLELGINRIESLLNHLEAMLRQTSPHHIEELAVADIFIIVHVEDVEEAVNVDLGDFEFQLQHGGSEFVFAECARLVEVNLGEEGLERDKTEDTF